MAETVLQIAQGRVRLDVTDVLQLVPLDVQIIASRDVQGVLLA